jgi:hypothetical protein
MCYQRRKSLRAEDNSPATIYAMDRRSTWPCSLSDLSNGGAKISGVLAITIPNEFVLCISNGDTRKCRVRWRMAFTLGVEFIDRKMNQQKVNPEHEVLEAAE